MKTLALLSVSFLFTGCLASSVIEPEPVPAGEWGDAVIEDVRCLIPNVAPEEGHTAHLIITGIMIRSRWTQVDCTVVDDEGNVLSEGTGVFCQVQHVIDVDGWPVELGTFGVTAEEYDYTPSYVYNSLRSPWGYGVDDGEYTETREALNSNCITTRR